MQRDHALSLLRGRNEGGDRLMTAPLRSLIAVSLIGGTALHICPPNGTKQILKLLITAILAAAVLTPLRELDYDLLGLEEAKLGSAEARIIQESRQRERSLEEQAFIRNCEGYIRSHAEELGIYVENIRLSVVRTGEERWEPYSVSVEVSGNTAAAEELCQLIHTELGIPSERQAWTLNE